MKILRRPDFPNQEVVSILFGVKEDDSSKVIIYLRVIDDQFKTRVEVMEKLGDFPKLCLNQSLMAVIKKLPEVLPEEYMQVFLRQYRFKQRLFIEFEASKSSLDRGPEEEYSSFLSLTHCLEDQNNGHLSSKSSFLMDEVRELISWFIDFQKALKK